MRRQRHTKIIATLGPATASRESLRRLFEAGVDVFCMDMRYGTHADHLAHYKLVREMEQEAGRPIGVLMDLQGPRLRTGGFRQAGVELVPGQRFAFDLSPGLGDHSRVGLPYPEMYGAMSPGDMLCLDDGTIKLKVESATGSVIACRVDAGGFVRDGACLKAPNVRLPISSLTARDEEDLALGLDIGIDWIALAFVQHGQDVAALRERIGARHCPKIIARLEKLSALEHLDSIVEAADAVMVCRAELGAELDMEELPIIQRRIVRACRERGRPVVIATQMLDSMVHAATPTRAETGDVAAAVQDGVDAILLSAETARGKHGVEAVSVASRIARRLEADPAYMENMVRQASKPPDRDCAGAISAAVGTMAGVLPLSFAAAYTQSGQTCLAVARVRPPSPILGLSPSLATVRMLSMVWGVHPIHMDNAASVEEMVERTTSAARRNGFTEEGRPFVMVAGMPFGTQGAVNLMRIGWA